MQIDTRKISNTTIISAVIVALLMMLATELVLRQVRREEIQEAGENQQNALRLFWELLSAKGSGFQVRGANLMLGEYLINGNNELPDKVKEITGAHATIFMGDTRVATNVLLPNGRRALGTKLTGPAYDAVFGKGIPFRGETLILGGTYFTAYDPIKDNRGKTIGVLFAGSRQSEYLAAYYRTSTRIRIINGTLTCIFILCAFLLLTERKRSERAIHKQLDFLQVIIDTIPSPIFYKDADGKYLGFNKIYGAFVGLPRELMLGKTVHDLWNKDLADQFLKMDQDLFRAPGIQVYETAVGHADGTRHDVIMNKASFRNQDGSVGGIVGVMQDITERKVAEKEIMNAYRRIADILEFLPDATFVVDEQGRVIAWNRAIEVMTGVAKEEILGEGDFAYALPFYGVRRRLLIDMLDEHPEIQRRSYSGIARNGKTLIADARIALPGGERYLWSAATPLFDLQGNKVGGIQTLRDVTEVRLAQQERNRLEVQMHHSSTIESLMSQLSHDLRTPLTPLFALLPMVRRGVADPRLERMLDICQDCITQMQGLTTKALDLVRLSARSAPLELESLGLAAIAQDSVRNCAAQLDRRSISCLNAIDPALAVLGSREQLALLFDNLLSNAARYAVANGEVRISAVMEAGTVVVSVQDDGIGLEPGHQELIFNEFFKADAARHDTGTQGLGLAICKSIVFNHRGKIWAESPGLNLGTTISFTLQPAEPAQYLA